MLQTALKLKRKEEQKREEVEGGSQVLGNYFRLLYLLNLDNSLLSVSEEENMFPSPKRANGGQSMAQSDTRMPETQNETPFSNMLWVVKK